MKRPLTQKLALVTMAFVALILVSCSFSRPPALTITPPVRILKFVAFSKDDAVRGEFSLADAATNQTASAGTMHLQIYTMTSLSLGSSSESSMKMKTTIYENTYALGLSNFHWDSFGTFLTVKDLACHFAVPYSVFKVPMTRGNVATIKLEFRPDGTNLVLSAVKNIVIY